MSWRKTWDKDSLKRSVSAVHTKEIVLLQASKEFNVPGSTLKEWVNKVAADEERWLFLN
jgi:hypothetical protein